MAEFNLTRITSLPKHIAHKWIPPSWTMPLHIRLMSCYDRSFSMCENVMCMYNHIDTLYTNN